MPRRVSQIDRIRAEIDQRLTAEGGLGRTLEDVAVVGARLLLQTALERRSASPSAVSAISGAAAPGPATATAPPRSRSRPPPGR
jgi:hypothetical protein